MFAQIQKKLPISFECRSLSLEVAKLVDSVVDDFEDKLIVMKSAYQSCKLQYFSFMQGFDQTIMLELTKDLKLDFLD